MKMFLDVGANIGQSALAAIDPRFNFDRIHCFEPAPNCWAKLESIGDPRICVHRFGLWKKAETTQLFAPGNVGASLFRDPSGTDEGCQIELVRVSDWVSDNIRPNDIAFMKLNCEGSECDIINDLVDTEEIKQLYSIMIDFDVRKIPAKQHEEVETLRRLRKSSVNSVCFCDDVMIGKTHEERIQYWLELFGASDALSLSELVEKYSKRRSKYSRKSKRLRSLKRSMMATVVGRCLPRSLKERLKRIMDLIPGA